MHFLQFLEDQVDHFPHIRGGFEVIVYFSKGAPLQRELHA